MLKDAVRTDFFKEVVNMEDGRYIVFYEFPSGKSNIYNLNKKDANAVAQAERIDN